MRYVVPGLFFSVLVACTGGPGPIDQTGNGSSGASGLTSSSGGNSGGTSSSGDPTSGGGGGGSGTTTKSVSASEVSQACVESTDCVAVYEGSVCDACKCPNAAIAKDSLAEYGSKFQNASSSCPTTDVECAADCAQATPVCSQGTCTINR